MPTPQQLRAELDADPYGLGYATLSAAGDDTALARRLNDPTTGRTRVAPMRLSQFAEFLMGRGLRRKIKQGESHTDETVASVCIGLDDLLKGAADRSISPSDPGTAALIDILVTAGIATTVDRDALTAACTVQCGRPAELWGADVSTDDVAAAYGRPR